MHLEGAVAMERAVPRLGDLRRLLQMPKRIGVAGQGTARATPKAVFCSVAYEMPYVGENVGVRKGAADVAPPAFRRTRARRIEQRALEQDKLRFGNALFEPAAVVFVEQESKRGHGVRSRS